MSPPLIAILGVTGLSALLFAYLTLSGKALDKIEAIRRTDPKRAAQIMGMIFLVIAGLKQLLRYIEYLEYRDEHPHSQVASQATFARLDPLKVTHSVQPAYPAVAKQSRVPGTVRFRALIGKTGQVEELTLIEGNPSLVPAALDAAKQWVFSPPTAGGRPAKAETEIDIKFRLETPGVR